MTLFIVSNILEAIRGFVDSIAYNVSRIGDVIGTIINFIGDLISEIMNVGSYILDSFRIIYQAITLIPTSIRGFAVICIGVFVAFQILGRESGAK